MFGCSVIHVPKTRALPVCYPMGGSVGGRRDKRGFVESHSERSGMGQPFMDILIAEDDPISRRTLEVTLAKWGHRVIVTTDGLAALERLSRDDAPRVAILDWMMPKLDGLTVCRRLR